MFGIIFVMIIMKKHCFLSERIFCSNSNLFSMESQILCLCLSRNFLEINFTKYCPVLTSGVNAQTECFNFTHFSSYCSLRYSKTVKTSDGVKSIFQSGQSGEACSFLVVIREKFTGGVEEPVAGVLRVTRHELEGGEREGRLEYSNTYIKLYNVMPSSNDIFHM